MWPCLRVKNTWFGCVAFGCSASRQNGVRRIKLIEKSTLFCGRVDDEKPTAVRQKLKALEDIARYKKTLHGKTKDKALSINYLQFKDTMYSLIQEDIQSLLQLMESK